MWGRIVGRKSTSSPAVIAAVDDDVDFLPTILPHIDDDQVVLAAAIERDAPGIAQAVSEDFRQPLLAIGIGIVLRNAVGSAVIDVDAQHLAQQGVELLAVALGRMTASARHVADIVESAAVADGPVQVTIRPKREATAVVIPVRLVDFQND